MKSVVPHGSDNRLKVAVVVAFPVDPNRPHGGVEAVSVNLVPALARRTDLEVHVVTHADNVAESTQQTWEGATIHRLPVPRGPMLLRATGAGRKQIRDYLQALNPDVVHAHDTYGLMTKGLALPRVFTIHGFIHEDTRYGGGAAAWVRSRLWKRIETAGWADQPHIISISPYVRERLRGIGGGEIHDIENPISASCFQVLPQRGQGIIFSAALICQRKNTLGLLQAFARLSRTGSLARLRLAGRMVEPEYGRRVEEFIQQNSLSEKVTLLGSVTAAKVREELISADVFALLSYEEGAPMGVAEAMAAGVPVVTSNRCGMPYMVRQGETGFLVQPDDAAAAAASLGRILNEPGLGVRLGARAREVAMDCYHPDRVAERTAAVYQRAKTGFEG